MTIEISESQMAVIKQYNSVFSVARISTLLNQSNVSELSDSEIVQILQITNACYRAGYPLITDQVYDNVFVGELQRRDPEHAYLQAVEPETVVEAKTVSLPQKMLSTDKAYSFDEIQKWIDKLIKAAKSIELDLDEVELRVTPKLDGYAAYDDGDKLYTRGDGVRGQDITRAFVRGLKVAGGGRRALGAGEIVIKKSYFESELSERFENSRNIQAAIIAEKKMDDSIQKAIDDGACVFYPFSELENWTGHYSELEKNFESICESIWRSVDFDIDGIIIETTVERLKESLGSTRRHHRWQIAFKVNEESADIEVLSVTPQTSRTGRVSPVAELEPTKLSGATISRATVHHYNMVKSNGVGRGAIVRIVRSGLVIPKIEKVVRPTVPDIPDQCPSCHTHLIWENDHLICPNKTDCPAQTENTLIHFFKTLGNVDGFGPKVVEKLHGEGLSKIHEIYQLTTTQLSSYGFGDKTSENLVNQLLSSRSIEIEDWRFLAAFGVTRLGFGNCEKLLEHHNLVDLFSISVEDMVKIDGFAILSAEAIYEGLQNIQEEFFKIFQLEFNLIETNKQTNKEQGNSPINGKLIVFTGTMIKAARSDMEKEAKKLGAKVAKSVTGKTSFLVTGDKVGANKINAAREKGVKVLTELEYLELIL